MDIASTGTSFLFIGDFSATLSDVIDAVVLGPGKIFDGVIRVKVASFLTLLASAVSGPRTITLIGLVMRM